PFTVTTIDHLCISLTGTREDHHAIFFGLAHSCIVIDEADFYDDFTQQNIVTLLRALRILKVPVLLMSATVPESAISVFSKSGFEIKKIHSDESDTERSRCEITRHGKAENPNEIKPLLERAMLQPTIIYANTVSRAQDYYRWFKAQDFDDVILYHSRYIEPHKVDKENSLREMLGRDAWKNGTQHGVAILTQIGEISVNISADLMISDLCPLDRLTQRIGRLSRFSENIGEVFIVEPQKTNKNGITEFYPAPYGSFVPNFGWQTSRALILTNERLKDGEYSAKDFVDLVNQLYPSQNRIEPHVVKNVRALEDMVVTNWLILPKQFVESDDDQTQEWKSRDIPFQQTIYAGFDDNGLDDEYIEPTNKSQLKEFEIRYGITCHSYEYQQALEEGIIESKEFQLAYDEIVFKPVIRSCSHYNQEVGLDFKGNEYSY
ncbi:MAG: CRISPR-associated helicase Cas3', partial [Blastocatellia bacterium]|nr:CRISPR-associated helicase Cas3' [Blastocatellia bacterium]